MIKRVLLLIHYKVNCVSAHLPVRNAVVTQYPVRDLLSSQLQAKHIDGHHGSTIEFSYEPILMVEGSHNSGPILIVVGPHNLGHILIAVGPYNPFPIVQRPLWIWIYYIMKYPVYTRKTVIIGPDKLFSMGTQIPVSPKPMTNYVYW